MVTDYMRGIRFVGGQASGVLLPGSYRFNPNKEMIVKIDLRPQPILIERMLYRDAPNRQAVISIATELAVSDPELAATRLKDSMGDGFNLLLGALRDFVGQRAADVGRSGLTVAAREITAALNTELGKVGMKTSPVEITEAWAAPFSHLGAGAPLA